MLPSNQPAAFFKKPKSAGKPLKTQVSAGDIKLEVKGQDQKSKEDLLAEAADLLLATDESNTTATVIIQEKLQAIANFPAIPKKNSP